MKSWNPQIGLGLIVTDHLMPVMSGPQFVTELRHRGFTLPVIVLSGLPDAEAAYDGLKVDLSAQALRSRQPHSSGGRIARGMTCAVLHKSATIGKGC